MYLFVIRNSYVSFRYQKFICIFSLSEIHMYLFVIRNSYVSFRYQKFICIFSLSEIHMYLFVIRNSYVSFRYQKFICIFSFFRKIKIERNTKLKLIAYILGLTCYKISPIEAPKLVSIKQKERKKRAVEGGRIIFRPTVHTFQL